MKPRNKAIIIRSLSLTLDTAILIPLSKAAMEEVEGGVKARSFRYEDYNARRVFLRSYPLQWEDGVEKQEDGSDEEITKLSLKGKIVAAFHWGEDKVVLLGKIKNKVALYLVSCKPFGFRSSSKRMLTV